MIAPETCRVPMLPKLGYKRFALVDCSIYVNAAQGSCMEARMARRLIMALLLCALAASPASAQGESSLLRVREAAAALVRGNVDQAITIYTEALEDKSLPN